LGGGAGDALIFEQPNLDVPEESHLYFDPGDGVLITVFTREDRKVDSTPNPEGIGNLHHIAFNVSQATYTQVRERLEARGIHHSGEIDRGFMNSIYFRDPLGQLLELASYKFFPPVGISHGEVLLEAHKLRVAEGAYNITDAHLADAIELLTQRTRHTLSDDREAKHAYTKSKNVLWESA